MLTSSSPISRLSVQVYGLITDRMNNTGDLIHVLCYYFSKIHVYIVCFFVVKLVYTGSSD